MKPRVFIDGREGTTGLQIDSRLDTRNDIELLTIDPDRRKDSGARSEMLNAADFVFLCLPDQAAREAVAMVKNPKTRIIDASTAHRTAPDWAYGLAELSAAHRADIAASSRVSNPGCHATGVISLIYPLTALGILPPGYPLTAHSVTGYTGAGKTVIAEYEAAGRSRSLDSPRQYALGLTHKHLPEITAVCGLSRPPVFNPIIADFPQGMAVTVPLYLDLLERRQTVDSLRDALLSFYAGQRFIKVMDKGLPEDGFLPANEVVGSNELRIYVSGNVEAAALIAVFDNLGKGASGAAVQNLNIMMGIDESTGI